MGAPMVIIQTTLPRAWNEAEVGAWVQALLDANLIACAHIDEVRSIYRWEGAVQSEPEWRIQLKTTLQGADSLRMAVRESHPYEVCELIQIDAEADEAYHDWMQKEV